MKNAYVSQNTISALVATQKRASNSYYTSALHAFSKLAACLQVESRALCLLCSPPGKGKKKHVSAMQWTLTQILVACAFPTLHFSVTWHPSEDVRYTLSFQPQELHRCTSGTFHWALQQGKDMRCLGGGVRFRNVLWHIICQSLSVSASACSRALFEVETPVETACALFMNFTGDAVILLVKLSLRECVCVGLHDPTWPCVARFGGLRSLACADCFDPDDF